MVIQINGMGVTMDNNAAKYLGEAYLDMLYGLDLLYVLWLGFHSAEEDVVESEKVASSIHITWEWLNEVSKKMSLCLDALETEQDKT